MQDHKFQIQNKQIYFYFFIISVLIFYFIFAPSINLLYYSFDDYRYSLGGFSKQCSADDGFYFMLTLGRPIQAYMDCLSFKFASTLEHMKLVRFLTVFLLSCCVSVFAHILYRMGLSFWNSFFLAGSVFLIQEVYSGIILMGSVPLPLAILFELIGYLSINYSYSNKTTITKLICVLLSGIFVLLGLLSYPAMAFFFSILILAKLLFSEKIYWLVTRKQIFLELVLFFGTCLIYYIYANLNMHFNAQAPIPSSYRLDHPNSAIIEIFKRLMTILNIFDSHWRILPANDLLLQGWIALVVIAGGLLSAALRSIKGSFSHVSQMFLAFIVTLIACNAFLLAMPDFQFIVYEPWLLFSSLASGLLIFFWSLLQLFYQFPNHFRNLLATFCIGIFFLIGSYQANIVMLARASTFENVLNENRKVIDEYLRAGNKLQRLHFVLPKSIYPYDKFFQSNAVLSELTHGTTQLTWCALPRGVPGEEKDHQKEALECIHHLKPNEIAVTYSYLNDPYAKTDNMLIIDKLIAEKIDFFNDFLKRHFNCENWSLV